MKHLASLHRRIMDVGSKQDRKKNPFDPLGNPVFFFTKDQKDEKNVSLNGFAKKVVSFTNFSYFLIGEKVRGKDGEIENGARSVLS